MLVPVILKCLKIIEMAKEINPANNIGKILHVFLSMLDFVEILGKCNEKMWFSTISLVLKLILICWLISLALSHYFFHQCQTAFELLTSCCYCYRCIGIGYEAKSDVLISEFPDLIFQKTKITCKKSFFCYEIKILKLIVKLVNF